jgi:transposase-like protein
MRRRGRPGQGLGHIDPLEGSAASKHRLRVMLTSLSGELTVEQACRELGLGPARFHVLRRQALEGALAGLSPKRRGRPALREPAVDARVSELQHRVEELELSMPHLLRREGPGTPARGKKEALRKQRKRSRRQP